jgi:hypothetical protein
MGLTGEVVQRAWEALRGSYGLPYRPAWRRMSRAVVLFRMVGEHAAQHGTMQQTVAQSHGSSPAPTRKV